MVGCASSWFPRRWASTADRCCICEYRIELVSLGTPKPQIRIRHVRNRVGALLDGREGHPGSKVVVVGGAGMTLIMMGHGRGKLGCKEASRLGGSDGHQCRHGEERLSRRCLWAWVPCERHCVCGRDVRRGSSVVSAISMSVLIIFFIISAPYSLFFFSSTRADLSMKQISTSRPDKYALVEIHQNECARSISE